MLFVSGCGGRESLRIPTPHGRTPEGERIPKKIARVALACSVDRNVSVKRQCSCLVQVSCEPYVSVVEKVGNLVNRVRLWDDSPVSSSTTARTGNF